MDEIEMMRFAFRSCGSSFMTPRQAKVEAMRSADEPDWFHRRLAASYIDYTTQERKLRLSLIEQPRS